MMRSYGLNHDLAFQFFFLQLAFQGFCMIQISQNINKWPQKMCFKWSLLAKRVLTMRFPSLKDVGIYYELFGTMFYDTTCFSQHWKTQSVIVLTAEDQQKPGHCLKCAVSFHADSSALHFLEDINREQKGKKKKVWPKRHCKSILLLSVHLSLALKDHQRTRAAIKNLSQLKLARRRDVDDLGSNDTSFISKIYILQGIKRSVQKS